MKTKKTLFTVSIVLLLLAGNLAVFGSTVKAVNYYHVTVLNPQGAGNSLVHVHSSNGIDTSIPSIFYVPQDTVMTFQSVADTGYTFWRYYIAGQYSGYTTQDPLTISVGGDFTVTPYFNQASKSWYWLNITTSYTGDQSGFYQSDIGGYITATLEPQGQVLGEGNYNLSAGQGVTFHSFASANFAFMYYYIPQSSLGEYPENPFSIMMTNDMQVMGYFQTASVIAEVGQPQANFGSTTNNWNLNDGTLYNCFATVLYNGTISASGTYFILSTNIGSDVNQLGQWTQVAGGDYTNGVIYFGLQIDNYTNLLHQKIMIGVLDNNQNHTYAQEVGSAILQLLNLGSTFLDVWTGGLVQSTNFNTTVVNFIPSEIYTINWQGVAGSTPTPTLYSFDYGLVGAIVILVGFTFGLTYLARKYYAIGGLLVGLILGITVDVMLNLLPLYAIFAGVLLLVALILLLVKGGNK